MGLLPDEVFEQELLQLHVGDACLLVTDGVTEALEGDTLLERDLEASRERHESALELCQAVMARALSGHGPPGIQGWDDDRTVVVVKVLASYANDLAMFTTRAVTTREVITGGVFQ